MKYAILLLALGAIMACGAPPSEEEVECDQLGDRLAGMNCSWNEDECFCSTVHGGPTPAVDDVCSPPPDDWPVLELSVDDFYGFGPLVQQGSYNLGGYRLVVPGGMWIDRGLGWYPQCSVDQDPCPDEVTRIYLTAGSRPDTWLAMEWYRDDPATWWRSDFETEPDCSCPGGAFGYHAAAVDTIACYLEKLNANRP